MAAGESRKLLRKLLRDLLFIDASLKRATYISPHLAPSIAQMLAFAS